MKIKVNIMQLLHPSEWHKQPLLQTQPQAFPSFIGILQVQSQHQMWIQVPIGIQVTEMPHFRKPLQLFYRRHHVIVALLSCRHLEFHMRR